MAMSSAYLKEFLALQNISDFPSPSSLLLSLPTPLLPPLRNRPLKFSQRVWGALPERVLGQSQNLNRIRCIVVLKFYTWRQQL